MIERIRRKIFRNKQIVLEGSALWHSEMITLFWFFAMSEIPVLEKWSSDVYLDALCPCSISALCLLPLRLPMVITLVYV